MVSTLTALEYVSSHIQQHVRIHRKARTHKSHSSPSLVTVAAPGHAHAHAHAHGAAMGVPTAATPHVALSRTHATAAAAAAVAMQKSKSSSSVVQHGSRVAKKLWRRSKSQGRGLPAPACTWTSQGHCTWTNLEGRAVTLGDVPLLGLSELERRVLCKVALAKLQEINLGVNVRIPTESVSGPAVQKPKRRAYLLKRKALTTGIFDTGRKDSDKDKAAGDGGLVFGIPLAQCLENDRAGRAFPLGRFHVLLNSLFKVLFNFPSRYLFAIGLVVVFSLRWSLPPA